MNETEFNLPPPDPAWEIPGTEGPNRLQSMGLQRVNHHLTTKQQQLTTKF